MINTARTAATERPVPGAIRPAGQPRWLWPLVAIGLVVTGLVVGGALPHSPVLSFALFASMLLMHRGGHGSHGGSGWHSGHEAHGGGPASDTEALSQRSHGSQFEQRGSAAGLDDRAANDPKSSEIDDHDQHSSHGCH